MPWLWRAWELGRSGGQQLECAQMLYLQNEIIDMLQVRLSAPIKQYIVFQLCYKIP